MTSRDQGPRRNDWVSFSLSLCVCAYLKGKVLKLDWLVVEFIYITKSTKRQLPLLPKKQVSLMYTFQTGKKNLNQYTIKSNQKKFLYSSIYLFRWIQTGISAPKHRCSPGDNVKLYSEMSYFSFSILFQAGNLSIFIFFGFSLIQGLVKNPKNSIVSPGAHLMNSLFTEFAAEFQRHNS